MADCCGGNMGGGFAGNIRRSFSARHSMQNWNGSSVRSIRTTSSIRANSPVPTRRAKLTASMRCRSGDRSTAGLPRLCAMNSNGLLPATAMPLASAGMRWMRCALRTRRRGTAPSPPKGAQPCCAPGRVWQHRLRTSQQTTTNLQKSRQQPPDPWRRACHARPAPRNVRSMSISRR